MTARPLILRRTLGLIVAALATSSGRARAAEPEAPTTPDGGCTLEGVVHAEGVHTVLVTASSPDPRDGPIRMVVTDADGGFEIPLSGEGPFRISTAAPGYHPVQAIAGCDGHPIDLTIEPGEVPVLVSVRGQDNKPIEGAMAVLSMVLKTDVDPAPAVLGVSDEGISFSLDRGQTYRVSVSAPGFSPDGTEFASEDAQELRFQFFLARLHAVSGIVTNAAGQPVQGATVVRAPTDRQPIAGFTITAADGTFSLATDPHETCTIAVHADSGVAMVELEPTEQAQSRTLVLGPGAAITGHLQDDAGQGVAGSLRWRHVETGLVGQARADESGAFEAEGVPAAGSVELWSNEGFYEPVRVQAGSSGVVVPYRASDLDDEETKKPGG